ncbi:MAG TPA: hypothetical protein VH143_27980 [Kofleriaceae bacterium]|jgi:hypothetical protein|nr:hypothetical protein [Kofleriaceae bacterium]
MKRFCALIVVAGCSFHPSSASTDASGDGGANAIGIDAADPGPCVTWDAINVAPCDASLGTAAGISIGSGSFVLDTDSGQLLGGTATTLPGALVAQTPGPELRVVNASQFAIASGAMISVTGSHPLVIVVHADATISGTLDVSAFVDEDGTSTPGPGADDPMQCAGGSGADGIASTGTGGGGGAGGGGFGDQGGDGGDGDGGGHGGHGGHGAANGSGSLQPLRGGCSGGNGGAALTAGTEASSGGGGGALEITALGTITIDGSLFSAGAGGGTPEMINSGGAGGGAGGAILLDGDVVQVNAGASLCANGGGGGEGGQIASASAPGQPGTCSETLDADGGMINADGGDGGNGGGASHTAGTKGAGASGGAGGGGAGGSVGRIRARGRGTPATLDPAATVSPAAAS